MLVGTNDGASVGRLDTSTVGHDVGNCEESGDSEVEGTVEG